MIGYGVPCAAAYDILWPSEFVCMSVLLRTIVFADENFRYSVYLMVVKILICEIFRRNDGTSSCNHDIDLVIGKALVFC